MDASRRTSIMQVFADPRHDGMLRRDQLRALGCSDDDIDWELQRGSLRSRRRGVLEPVGIPDSPHRQQRAALLAVGDRDAVLSHRAAGGLHRLPHLSPGAIELTVTRARSARLEGVRVHTARSLDPADVTVIDGLPCTALARTVVDLAPAVDAATLRKMVAHVERRLRPNGLRALSAAAARIGPKRRPDVAPLLDLLARVDDGDDAFLDVGGRCLAAFARLGLPAPVLEHPVTWSGHDHVLDAAFVEERIDVEFDDDCSHATRIGSRRDKDRDRRARRAGWIVERAHQETDPYDFARDVARHLRARHQLRSTG